MWKFLRKPKIELPYDPAILLPGMCADKTNARRGGGAKTAEEQDGDATFSPRNSSKERFNAEQASQNNFWSLAQDTRRPEKQPTVFERR